MKFVPVFITYQMAAGPANLGPLHDAPVFENAEYCQSFIRHNFALEGENHREVTGWHCVPDVASASKGE